MISGGAFRLLPNSSPSFPSRAGNEDEFPVKPFLTKLLFHAGWGRILLPVENSVRAELKLICSTSKKIKKKLIPA